MKNTIRNVEIYGINESLIGSGYPMLDKPYTENEFLNEINKIEKSENNIHSKRTVKLSQLVEKKHEGGHDTALQGIVVQFDLTFPVKAWVEIQRYHFIDFVSSMSTMHRLKSFELDTEDAFDENVDPRTIVILKELQIKFNETGLKEDYLKLLMSAPVGMNVTARMTTNYRQLKTIYKQRRHHRLPVWHVFCDWVETLPYMNEFLGLDRE